MTPERVKDIMMGVKTKLIDLTQQYKLSRNSDCITQLHLNVWATDERLREMESNKKLKVDS